MMNKVYLDEADRDRLIAGLDKLSHSVRKNLRDHCEGKLSYPLSDGEYVDQLQELNHISALRALLQAMRFTTEEHT